MRRIAFALMLFCGCAHHRIIVIVKATTVVPVVASGEVKVEVTDTRQCLSP